MIYYFVSYISVNVSTPMTWYFPSHRDPGSPSSSLLCYWRNACQVLVPDSKVHGANMGPTWGRQDPGRPHVGPMNLAIWGGTVGSLYNMVNFLQNTINRQPIAHMWGCDMGVSVESILTMNYSGVIWASWHLRPPRLFVNQLVQTNIESKPHITGPFWGCTEYISIAWHEQITY